jgi:radical SAM superfamily enzyme YgiQ (UPF0313 family)
MNKLERRDQPIVTIANAPPTERSILNGKRSIGVYSGIKIPALGSAVIAGVLRGEGYQNVTTLDPRFNKKSKHFETDDAKFTESDFNLLANSDIVGVSSMTRNREVSLRLIEWIKSNNPNVIVIAGGPDATFKPEKWLSGEKSADFVVRNEGEKTIVELMRALKNGDSVEGIGGISYKRDGSIINNEKRQLLTEEELSNTPLPFFPKNVRENSDTHVVESKRGCPNRCDFCSVTALYEGSYRLKDDKTVINLIKEGKKGKSTFFVDDNFAHKSRLEETKRGMQAIIDSGLNDRKYHMQLDTVTVNTDREFIKLAVRMGLFAAFLGIESVDPDVLKGMHKAATADQNINAVRIFEDNLVLVIGMEMLGGKGETRKSIDTLRKWNKQSGINGVQIFAMTPIVGSKLADSKLLLPIAERDTNLIDGQRVLSIPDYGFTCSGLQQEIFDADRDFYSLRNMPNSLKPLRHFFKNPERSLKLALMNIAVRTYARKLLTEMTNSEYTKNFNEYLKQIDDEIYAEGKRAIEEQGKPLEISRKGIVFDVDKK